MRTDQTNQGEAVRRIESLYRLTQRNVNRLSWLALLGFLLNNAAVTPAAEGIPGYFINSGLKLAKGSNYSIDILCD